VDSACSLSGSGAGRALGCEHRKALKYNGFAGHLSKRSGLLGARAETSLRMPGGRYDSEARNKAR